MIGTLASVRTRLLTRRLSSLVVRDGQRAWPLVIVGNAGTLVGTSVVSSGLGAVFWWLAARQFAPAALGLSAAAISATLFIGSVSVFGFATLLVAELPLLSASEQGELISTGLVFAGLAGAILGALFALLAPLFLGDFRTLQPDAGTAALFAVAVGATPVGLILDQVVVGRLRGELQLVRNTIFAVGKLVALAIAAALTIPHDAITIFATWPLANVLSLAIILRTPRFRDVVTLGRPRIAMLRRLGGAALSHHALNLSIQLPSLILPVLVTAQLSATANAYFYTAWMIASVAFLPQNSLATTLFAIGVREPAALVSRARLTMLLGFSAGVGMWVLVMITGDWILTVFGHQYAEQAGLVLRLLTPAAVPLMVKNHFIAFLRIHRRIRLGIFAIAAGGALELTGAAVGARLGNIPGLSIGWVLALTLEALCMLPSVLRTVGLGQVLARRPGPKVA